MFCLMKNIMRHNTERIQSKLHKIRIYDVCKISLSCFDDKRYILYDEINQVSKKIYKRRIFLRLHFTSICIEGPKAKLYICFFRCVLRKI